MVGRMDDESNVGSFWMEEINGKVQTPVTRKRKYRTKKKEFHGWGSVPLILFLQSIGRDTKKEIAQSEVANIVMEYVKQKSLFHKTKKKRIECDEKLHSLFKRKTISRLKINDLLESHFAENCEESSDDVLFDSEEDDAFSMCETPRTAPSEKRSQLKKPVFEKPRSCFAAVVPANIKLVYLKRSLVEKLLTDPETFETKVVGSFIRIKSDPNDYLQKNSHQLLQVTGIKKSSEVNGEIHLQASGFFKDIRIQMLSDDNFSEEECEDLHRRVRDGLVKRPMTVDMEHRARVLHEDMTKHWLARELTLLQNLIDRANEKGWRRELEEYLQRREKLQRPDEQKRLLCEFPQVIADDQKTESTTPDDRDQKVENNLQEFWQAACTKSSLVTEDAKAVTNAKLDITDLVKPQNNLPRSIHILRISPDVPLLDITKNSSISICDSRDTTEHQSCGLPVQQQPEQQTDFAYKNDVSKPTKSHEAKISQSLPDKQIWPSQSSGLYVQQHLEQLRDATYRNGTPKPSQLDERKISQAFPNKQTGPSQVEVLELSDDLHIQQSTEQQTNLSHEYGESKPAESPEVMSSQVFPSRQIQASQLDVIELNDDLADQQPEEQQIDFAYNSGMCKPAKSHEAEISRSLPSKQIQPSQVQVTLSSKQIQPSEIQVTLPSIQMKPSEVIELSDDDDDDEEENEKANTTKLVPAVQWEDTSMWHYRDPSGNVQGPFSLTSLKRWSDAGYFNGDFRVWKSGDKQNESVLLVKILAQFFTI
ncbi:uncharacterized protein At5g08430 [Vigna radiata var. radiata]|uniref:Uncharacterized protein At5g08430 n=1 Tax=Vigna radiata var. radiata TaxID=3916 RepID=A0A1S3VFD4_VIGRR|nr:uncharacterized protein At5g08430 [Vigna radiata var. radiata]XP_022640121.1 uncharacterized protein At5g08430 [Vigna radiata var. radiata]